MSDAPAGTGLVISAGEFKPAMHDDHKKFPVLGALLVSRLHTCIYLSNDVQVGSWQD